MENFLSNVFIDKLYSDEKISYSDLLLLLNDLKNLNNEIPYVPKENILTIPIITDGQTKFNLPFSDNSFKLFINGALQRQNDYNIFNNILTWNNDFFLQTTDEFKIIYFS